MAKILENLHRTLLAGFALAAVVFLLRHAGSVDKNFVAFLFRWFHVMSGVLWIGLLWYFNFVQMPTMPKIPAELKPAISKHIAPAALFWFRWAALATVIAGLILAMLSGNLVAGLTFKTPTIGIGMWLALIMAFNVWFIIWPNQKKALGIVQVDDAAKAKAARLAMLVSRTNTMLSIPMLYCMVASRNIG
jgi:uncharacterized membrane protein